MNVTTSSRLAPKTGCVCSPFCSVTIGFLLSVIIVMQNAARNPRSKKTGTVATNNRIHSRS